MDFSNPPLGGFQTTKRKARGTKALMEANPRTRKEAPIENARSEKRENFTETEEERRKRTNFFVREFAGKFAGVEATTRRGEEIVDAAG